MWTKLELFIGLFATRARWFAKKFVILCGQTIIFRCNRYKNNCKFVISLFCPAIPSTSSLLGVNSFFKGKIADNKNKSLFFLQLFYKSYFSSLCNCYTYKTSISFRFALCLIPPPALHYGWKTETGIFSHIPSIWKLIKTNNGSLRPPRQGGRGLCWQLPHSAYLASFILQDRPWNGIIFWLNHPPNRHLSNLLKNPPLTWNLSPDGILLYSLDGFGSHLGFWWPYWIT